MKLRFNALIKIFQRISLSCCALLLFTSAAFADFEAVSQDDGNHYFTTKVQRGDGMGTIVRRLGVEPNWQRTEWMNRIREANPTMVDGRNNFILNPGDTLKVPLEALMDLKGYQNAAKHFQQPTATAQTEPIIAEPAPTETVMTEPAPPVTPEPQTAPMETNMNGSTLISEANTGFADIDFQIGPALNSIAAKTSTNFETDLVAEASAAATLRLGFNITDVQRMTIHASPYFAIYNPPPSIPFTQQSDWLFEGGVTYGFRVSSATYINAVWTSQTRHFAKFNFTNLELVTPLIHGAGLQLTGELISFNNSGIWYSITPKYLLPQTDLFEFDGGFQSQVSLQYQPNFKNRGFLMGIEHTYYQQTYVGGQQEAHMGLLYMGFRI